jgi:hypothetical protein
MPIYHREFAQRSAAWHAARCGIPTASEASKIITGGGKVSAQAARYMNRKLAEWAFGEPIIDEYESDFMQLGTSREPAARDAFTFQTGIEVEEVGFVTTDDGLFGVSPDGLIDGGTLQIKAPSAQVHIGYLLNPQSLCDEYIEQMHAERWCLEAERQFMCSYHPRLPLVVIEFKPGPIFSDAWARLAGAFIRTMVEARAVLTERYGLPHAPAKTTEEKSSDPAERFLSQPFDWTDADTEELMKGRLSGS